MTCIFCEITGRSRPGQSILHLHVHIVPRRKKDDLKGFFWPRTPYRDEDHMLDVQNAIVESVLKLI